MRRLAVPFLGQAEAADEPGHDRADRAVLDRILLVAIEVCKSLGDCRSRAAAWARSVDTAPDQAVDLGLDLLAVAGAAGLAAAVAGGQVLHSAGALGQGLAHQIGIAGEGKTGVCSLGLSLRGFRSGGRRLSLGSLGGEGAGAGRLGQLHADLGQAREHLALLQRAAAAIGLDVEIGGYLLHRTYHERRIWASAMNIVFTDSVELMPPYPGATRLAAGSPIIR